VPGLIVTIGWSSATASESFKWANAVCPHGTVILGGGADIIDGGHDVRLTSMVPAAPAGSTLTGVAATCPTGKKVIGTGAAAARSTRPAAKCLDTPLAAGGCGIRPERA